jgi:hypothetical protein
MHNLDIEVLLDDAELAGSGDEPYEDVVVFFGKFVDEIVSSDGFVKDDVTGEAEVVLDEESFLNRAGTVEHYQFGIQCLSEAPVVRFS